MILRPHFLAATSLAAFLGGCTIGPDFHAPVSAPPAASLLAAHGSSLDSQANENAPPEKWWMVFNDPMLSSLEERVATQNLDVRAASARLLQARAQRRITGGDQYPSLGGGASYQRSRINPKGPEGALLEGGSPSIDIFKAGFDASWELDLWGRVRRGVEAANARQQASADSRRLTLLSAEAEVARDYIRLRGSQTLFDVLRDNLQIAQNNAKLTRFRFENGVTTTLDVANAEAQVASIEASIPPTEAERDDFINALSLLLALPPRALESELGPPRPMPLQPAEIPVGLPSDLLLRRPDVLQAEADLHAATAEIGAAKADFYPRISLTGGLASEVLQLSTFGSWSSRQFSMGPFITLPFFEGGRLRGMLDLRKAEQQEAAIHYQQTVLGAWHEVGDALADYVAEQRRRGSLARAVDENQLALSVAQRRYREGAIDFLNVLSVEKALLDARSEAIRSSVLASINLIKLHKALGGGWEAQFPDSNERPGASAAVTGRTMPRG
jgi:NodT family efflux transporter outer membrane factor (OMF) lipoprotein